jgi:L-lactate dehydrogenase complex protein LldF
MAVPSRQQIDLFAARLSAEVKAAVADGATAGVDKRAEALAADYDDADRLRRTAGRIRQHALDHLHEYLPQAEARLSARGVRVHYAWDTDTARELILRLIREDGGRRVAKSKSMVSEELDLARWLNERGVETVETDLGELIVQLDDDHPSHVVKPSVRSSTRTAARSPGPSRPTDSAPTTTSPRPSRGGRGTGCGPSSWAPRSVSRAPISFRRNQAAPPS